MIIKGHNKVDREREKESDAALKSSDIFIRFLVG